LHSLANAQSDAYPTTKAKEKVVIDLQTIPKEKRHEEYLRMVKSNRELAAERRTKRLPKAMKKRQLLFKIKDQRTKKQQEERKERRIAKQQKEITRPLASLEEGMEVEGTVTNVERFGCFVDIGAERDGLLHIQDMKADVWVARISDFLKTGDVVKVFVKAINATTNKLELSMKTLESIKLIDLDKEPLTAYEPDDELWGVVTKVTNFGAFIDCGAEVDAFLHIMDYPERVKGESATKSFFSGMRLRVYVKEVDLGKNRLKVTHERPETLPVVW